MSESKSTMVSEDWINGLVAVAFGGSVPERVAAWVDPAVCAEHFGASKLGIVGFSNDRPTRIRLSSDGEAARLRALAKEQKPEVAAWLDGLPEGEFLYETDGSFLRIYAWAVPTENGQVAYVWEDGEAKDVTFLDALPKGSFGDAGDFLSKVDTTYLLRIGHGDDARIFWTWDGASRDVDQAVAELGVAVIADVVQHFADGGQMVAPYSVEFGAGGTAVCAWSAYVGQSTEGLPASFVDGFADAATFAREVAGTLLPADADAGLALTRDHLYPALMGLQPTSATPQEHLAGVWRFLIGLLALEVPGDRPTLLERVHAVNRIAHLQEEAFDLAKMSYAASHPDSPTPEGVREGLAGLDLAGVRAEGQARLEEFERLAVIAAADPELDLHRYEGAAFELVTVRDLLQRAISGEFAAAEGPLHEYLVELGVTGYDDDPSLITLDNVDLDADAQDAAIEEALAMDMDDEDF